MIKLCQILLVAFALVAPARAMTNAFTYQGRLSAEGAPANDTFSMIFVLHSHPTDGDGIGVTVLPEVVVTNGLFTAPIAFAPQLLDGSDRWLAVHVRRMVETNAPFTELTPRQPLTPAPYALMAKSVPDGAIQSRHIADGAIGSAQLASNAVAAALGTGSITGEMLAPGSINHTHLAPGTAAANLAGQGQSAVASGGLVLSENGHNTNLIAAGYVRIGKVELVPEHLQEMADPPQNAGSLQRVEHSTIWTGTEYIIWGGRSPTSFTPFNDGVRYDPMANTWSYINSSNAPAGRYGHHAVWTGTEMIIYGGGGYYAPDEVGARYNPATGTWTLMSTNNAPVVYPGATAVWAGSVFVIWGGYSLSGDSTLTTHYHNTGGRYNPVNNTWLAMPTLGAPTGRYDHRAVWTGTEMILWGGQGENGHLDTGGRYNPINNQWLPMATVDAPTRRSGHTATWTGTEMMIWGGYGYLDGWGDNALLYTGARYNPANNSWTPMNTTNAPLSRSSHSAVWIGSRLVVWGGLIYATFGWDGFTTKATVTGGIYDPTTDSWLATSTLNAPRPRYGHTAAWTGSRMLVWDTVSIANQRVESGGRFDPVANSWAGLPPTGDVVARQNFTSVWSGTELLVWGGEDAAGNTMRSGLRFDPAQNQWSFMSLANTPNARKSPLSAWTGTEMIVWGGENSQGTKLRTGGRYNPATDTWIPLPTTNAPSQRTNATAVWAGGHFVVWGGRIGSIDTATGARFNPATGLWQPTALPPAGTLGRHAHTATSIGDEMVIWGGINVTNILADGARYNPVTDTWIALPGSVLSPRHRHSAVWNGSEFIVFGGANTVENYLEDGVRYLPATGTWAPLVAPDSLTMGRRGHHAVWAYDRMLVLDGNNYVLTHRPESESWHRGNEILSPIPSSVFWTGAEALWWPGDGGCLSYSPARTTYLYTRP